MSKIMDQLRKGKDLQLDERLRIAVLELDERLKVLEPCPMSGNGNHQFFDRVCDHCKVEVKQ